MKINNYDCIVLDLDGTIIESMGVKGKIFESLFDDLFVKKKMREYHRKHGGMNRYDKIRNFYEKEFGKKIDNETFERLTYEFSNKVVERYSDISLVDGLKAFLKRVSSDVYVLSAAPHEEVGKILENRNLSGYIEDYKGHPYKKIKELNSLKKSYNNILFIGDSREDLEASMEADVDFIARIHEGNERLCNNMIFFIQNFHEL